MIFNKTPPSVTSLDNLTALTHQFDPAIAVGGFRRFSEESYSYPSREAFAANAEELMPICHEQMVRICEAEGLTDTIQGAILPYIMEYAHRRYPYLVGNLNAYLWYGRDYNINLDGLARDVGVRKGDVVFDCGSHTGHVACAIASEAGPEGKVFCFDLFPQNNFLTLINQKLTQFNLEVMHTGVGRETGAIPASNLVQMAVVGPGCRGYKVSALDDFYSERPSFIKVDVEGFELEALLGAQKILHDLHPRVFIELHPQFFDRTGASYREIYRAFPEGVYRLRLRQPERMDVFESHLDAQTPGELFAEPIT